MLLHHGLKFVAALLHVEPSHILRCCWVVGSQHFGHLFLQFHFAELKLVGWPHHLAGGLQTHVHSSGRSRASAEMAVVQSDRNVMLCELKYMAVIVQNNLAIEQVCMFADVCQPHPPAQTLRCPTRGTVNLAQVQALSPCPFFLPVWHTRMLMLLGVSAT